MMAVYLAGPDRTLACRGTRPCGNIERCRGFPRGIEQKKRRESAEIKMAAEKKKKRVSRRRSRSIRKGIRVVLKKCCAQISDVICATRARTGQAGFSVVALHSPAIPVFIRSPGANRFAPHVRSATAPMSAPQALIANHPPSSTAR